MSVPPEFIEEAGRWLRWADEDLLLAKRTAADTEVVPRGGCVWAHQAAEKALKAMLVASGIDPPKVHNLVKLADMLGDHRPGPFEDAALAELSEWAILGRYPDDMSDATSEDAAVAVGQARVVVDIAKQYCVALAVDQDEAAAAEEE